jgi:hypothetical protein
MFRVVFHWISRLILLVVCLLVALPARAEQIDLLKSASKVYWWPQISSASSAICVWTPFVKRDRLPLRSGAPVRGENEL